MKHLKEIFKYLKENIKFLVAFIITISFSLIFLDSISGLLIKLGSNINNHFSSFIIGYLLISLAIIFRYIYLISKHYIHNKKVNFLVLFISSTYVIYRFIFTNQIEFIRLEGFPPFSDIIIVFAFLHLLNVIIKRKKSAKANRFFIEDTTASENIIDNELILDKLIKVTSDMKPKIAFNIGLNAVWGFGKTTFLERFEIKYRQENKESIIFWYKVWKNKTTAGIIENFFEELKQQLRPYSGDLSSSIDNYVKAVLDLSPSEIKKFLTTGIDIFNKNNSLENYFNEINSSIKKIDRQIIILLDDLDRLDKKEILNTLKLIRTISDFNNVIFIAGYDRKYIIETIKQPSHNYLDKIFNVELNLLPFSEDKLVYKLFELVDENFPVKIGFKEGFNEAFKELFNDRNKFSDIDLSFIINNSSESKDYIKLSYLNFLNTHRDIKRFFNEFKFYSSFLKSEEDVNPHDYILLKLLTYNYRNLESEIFNKIDDAISKKMLNIQEKKISDHPIPKSGDIYVLDDKSKKNIRDLLASYNKSDQEIILSSLNTLFSEKSYQYYEKHQNCIAKVDYTNIYLRNNIVEGVIKISEFKKAFNTNNLFELSNSFTNYKNQLNYSLNKELIIFIKNLVLINKDQGKDALKTINKIATQYLFQYDSGVAFLDGIYKNIYNSNTSDFQAVIVEIITETNDVKYLDSLLSELNIRIERSKFKSRNNPDFIDDNIKFDFLDITFIKKALLKKLEVQIDNEESVESVISTYHLFSERLTLGNKIMRSIESNKMLKGDIEKRIAQYFNSELFNFVRTSNDLEFHGFQPNFFLSSIFSNKTSVKEFLDDDKNQEKYDTIYKEGWYNLNDFIQGLNSKELNIDEVKLNLSKELMQAFIDNNYKPLDKDKYEEIENN